jgi:hypothetical protein
MLHATFETDAPPVAAMKDPASEEPGSFAFCRNGYPKRDGVALPRVE